MKTNLFDYQCFDCQAEGYVAMADDQVPRPCVLICHAWGGQSDSERRLAEKMVLLGFTGFAIDVYGKGKRGDKFIGNEKLMQPLLDNRNLLKNRLLASVSAAQSIPEIDPKKIAVLGLGFGGLCALDLARTGHADLKAAVSFYGPFDPPNAERNKIYARILIHQGDQDPIVPVSKIPDLSKELTESQADWQIQIYGNSMHAFNARGVNLPERGIKYNENSATWSWLTTESFLKYSLAPHES